MTRSDMLAHVGSMQQAAYVRPIEYQEGRTHGLKAVDVKNGPLRFMSMADKALDVALFEYCLIYPSPSPRDGATSRMPSSA